MYTFPLGHTDGSSASIAWQEKLKGHQPHLSPVPKHCLQLQKMFMWEGVCVYYNNYFSNKIIKLYIKDLFVILLIYVPTIVM